jgi:LmbE family N-acetylglucosaminyl deacetylase
MSCLFFVIGAHQASLSQQSVAWHPLPLPEPSDRLLIIAPHPDDEVLGCGGLIAEAVQRGAQVRVVFLTNGDGFPAAATLLCRCTPTARDFLALGKLRMEETQQAARTLGLPPESLSFLGYPDRHLWTMATAGGKPITASTTRRAEVPYEGAFHRGAPYSAPALVDDLRRIVADFQPTHIFVTHPLDDHPDHMAASLYLREAMAQARERGELLIGPQVLYYLVHRGDWPLPQGYAPDRPLLPPRGMTDEGWLSLTLSPDLREQKRRALYAHESQCAMLARFLNSFLRTNELFLREGDWLHRNPLDDNPALRLRPGADLHRIIAAREGAVLHLSLRTRKPLTAPLRLQITLVMVMPSGEWRTRAWLYLPERPRALEGRVQAEGEWLHFYLPDANLPRAIRAYLLVQSRLYQMELDRSGIVPLEASPNTP